MAFDSRLLIPLQGVSSLAGAGQLREAAASLARGAKVVPELTWVACTTAAMAGLRLPVERRLPYFVRLLSSSQLTETLEKIPPEQIAGLAEALSPQGLVGEMDLYVALMKMAAGVLEWESPGLLPLTFAGVVACGGLMELMVAIDATYLGNHITRAGYAVERLHRLERKFNEDLALFRERVRKEEEPDFAYYPADPRVEEICRGMDPHLFRDELMPLGFIDDFIQREFPRRKANEYPLFTIDFLSDLPPERLEHEGRGDCLSMAAMFSQLALWGGIKLELLNHPNHATLFHPKTGLVIDPRGGKRNFTTPAYWQEIGELGPSQEGDPLYALIANQLNHFACSAMEERSEGNEALPLSLLSGALRLYPDSFGANCVMALAQLKEGHLERAIEHSRRALTRNPSFVDARHILFQALYEKGDQEEALLEGERTVETAIRNRKAILRREESDERTLLHYGRVASFAVELGYLRLTHKGDVPGARVNFERALQLDPTNEKARECLEKLKKRG